RRHHLSTSAYLSFLLSCHAPHRALHSFPTRRSSDLPSTIKKKPSLSFFKTLIDASVISERLGCFVSSLSNSGAIGPSANNPSNLSSSFFTFDNALLSSTNVYPSPFACWIRFFSCFPSLASGKKISFPPPIITSTSL